MGNDRHPLQHQMKIYGPAALLVLAAFVLAYQFIKPAPPDRVVMATGGVDGAYHAFAKRYAERLAREGITLELRPTAGSVENVRLLRSGEVSLALVQGGVDDADSASTDLLSLGSVYYEPLWLFHRRESAIEDMRLVDFKVRITQGGTEAVTRVIIDSEDGQGRRWSTVGVSPNIVDASFEALLDAIDWKLLRDG